MKKVLSLALLVAVGAFIVLTGCIPPVLEAPKGLKAEGTTDELGIKLTWSPVTDAESYTVYFEGDLLEEEITVTEYSHAEPGKVGEYTVTAVAGNDESPDSDPLSTAPMTPVSLEVDEINGANESGIGWSMLGTGQIQKYSMASATNKDEVYFYYTDFAAGSAGTFELARASEVETDPSVTWDVGTGWHNGGVTVPMADAFDDIASVPTTGYESYNTAVINATQAVWIDAGGGDGYYGLIETTKIDVATVGCRVTFQKIKNFALFK